MPATEGPVQIRSFIAACLDPELLQKVQAEQQALQRRLGSSEVRWTGPDQLHLTLKFLGNVAATDLEALKLALPRAVDGIGPIHLRVQGLGCFPSPHRPSVIWFGLEGEVACLEQLQARIEQECSRYGSHSEERPFHPHLTVGRIKVRGGGLRRLGEGLKEAAVADPGDWTVSQVTLMRSQLRPAGSIYTPLLEVPLG